MVIAVDPCRDQSQEPVAHASLVPGMQQHQLPVAHGVQQVSNAASSAAHREFHDESRPSDDARARWEDGSHGARRHGGGSHGASLTLTLERAPSFKTLIYG